MLHISNISFEIHITLSKKIESFADINLFDKYHAMLSDILHKLENSIYQKLLFGKI
jgi:hypothetical protein